MIETKVITDPWALSTAIRAFDTVKGLDEAQVRSAYAEHSRLQNYLIAERAWQNQVRSWLSAEKKWQLRQETFTAEQYQAAKRGWDAIKKFVPSFDGAPTFDHLPESLQFRYAAFAAAVLGLDEPAEIKSTKQIAKELNQ